MTTNETTEYRSSRSSGNRSIYLRQPAVVAVQIGSRRLGERRDGKVRINQAALAAIDPANAQGQLLTAAIAWADAQVLTPSYSPDETFALAEHILSIHNTIDPLPDTRIVIDRTDVCSHGVPFSAVCDHCEP